MIKKIKSEFKRQANPEKAKQGARFFKTGKGEYGEGDKFIGLTVPEQRLIAKQFKDLSLPETEQLLQSPIHEHRLTALFILRFHFNAGEQEEVVKIYLRNTKYINNWDLVDSSAHYILGKYLKAKDRKLIYKLAKSKDFWEKRIAMLTCFAFIKDNDFQDALKVAKILLQDKHDLIHKAVGWMLREVGNRDLEAEEKFLKKYYKKMPRTMLRYAIEKFEKEKKSFYMKK